LKLFLGYAMISNFITQAYMYQNGILAAVIAGLVLGPYMPLVVNEGMMQETRSWVFRIVMFIIISLVLSVLLKYVKVYHELEKKRAYEDIITGYPNSNKFREDLNLIINEQKHNILSLIIFEFKNKEMISQYVNHDIGQKSFISLVKTADDFFRKYNIYGCPGVRVSVMGTGLLSYDIFYNANPCCSLHCCCQ